jgi:hypothetical protein
MTWLVGFALYNSSLLFLFLKTRLFFFVGQNAMSGTFAAVEKKVIGQGSCVAYKTYSKSHGMLVYKHFERELWALRKLDITTREKSTENHVNNATERNKFKITALTLRSNLLVDRLSLG